MDSCPVHQQLPPGELFDRDSKRTKAVCGGSQIDPGARDPFAAIYKFTVDFPLYRHRNGHEPWMMTRKILVLALALTFLGGWASNLAAARTAPTNSVSFNAPLTNSVPA